MARILACVMMMVLVGATWAADIDGVRVEDRITLDGGQQLVLNGAGVRNKLMFVKLYVGALYLAQKESRAEEILKDAGPKRIAMFVLADEIPARDLIASMNNSLSVNLSMGDLALVESRLTQLNQMMLKVGMLRKGGVVTLTYVPATGTHIRINGEETLVVKGADFFSVLLHIWIGEKPVDGRLKAAMLKGGT